MATLMRQTKNHNYQNEFALKQRYQYSKGTLHKSDSHEALNGGFQNEQSEGQQPISLLLLNRKRNLYEPTGKVGHPEGGSIVKNNDRTSLAGMTHATN